MIEVKGLTKKYGNRKAIQDLNFSVKKGEVVGFLGPNGAGKTTTMKIITGFMSPSEGSVTVGGLDVFEHPIEVKKQIGYLPEAPPLYDDMYVKEYLLYVACLKQMPYEERKKAVKNAIEKINLGEVQNRLIKNLSKGFKQRVGLAQAIVANPKVLILDEPTVGLDPKQVAEIRKLIQSLRGDHTLILSTHILPEVKLTCEKVIILHQGRIAAEDDLSNLAKNFYKKRGGVSRQRIVLQVARESEALLSSLKGTEGVFEVKKSIGHNFIEVEARPGDDVVEEISAHVSSKKAGLLELTTSGGDLEALFIEITSEPALKESS